MSFRIGLIDIVSYVSKVALRRQQTSQDTNRDTAQGKSQSMIALLAQKRVYQKHLRELQQTTLAKDICHGTLFFIHISIHHRCSKSMVEFISASHENAAESQQII